MDKHTKINSISDLIGLHVDEAHAAESDGSPEGDEALNLWEGGTVYIVLNGQNIVIDATEDTRRWRETVPHGSWSVTVYENEAAAIEAGDYRTLAQAGL